MNGAYAPPLTAPPPLLVGNQGATARSAAAPHYYPKGGFSMNECETYEECIQRRHNAFCKAVIRYAALSKISQLHREWKRQLSLDYLTNEKFVQFAEPEPDEEHPFTVCGQTVLLCNATLAAAISALPGQAQEEIRSTAGRHIQLALRRLREEMEVSRHE